MGHQVIVSKETGISTRHVTARRQADHILHDCIPNLPLTIQGQSPAKEQFGQEKVLPAFRVYFPAAGLAATTSNRHPTTGIGPISSPCLVADATNRSIPDNARCHQVVVAWTGWLGWLGFWGSFWQRLVMVAKRPKMTFAD